MIELQNRKENSHEAKTSSKSFSFEGTLKNPLNINETIILTQDDELVLGLIPAECYVTNMVLLTNEAYPAGATVSIGFLGDFPTWSLTEIAADIALDISNVSEVIALPTSGVVGGKGIWSGVNGLHLGAVYSGDDAVTGEATLIISYINFKGSAVNKAIRARSFED